MNKTKANLHNSSFSKRNVLIFATIFALIGGYIIFRSFAAGPVTFGVTTVGNTNDALSADNKQVSMYTAPQSGKISKITSYISGGGASSGSQKVKAVIYGDNGGTPGALLGTSSEITVNAGQAYAWVDFSFTTPVQVSAGTVWMGFIGSNTSRLILINANALSSNNLVYNGNAGGYAAGPTNPFGGETQTNGYQYALYATYASSSNLPGDLNGDGAVTVQDLSTLLSHFGQSGQTLATGDISGDGVVTIVDLSTLLSNYGTNSSPAPTVSLSASPSTVSSGASSTLTWSATNATSCTASGSWSGTKATSGSVSTGALSASATYDLTCTGAGGSGSGAATVTVSASGGSGGGVYWGAYIEGSFTYSYDFGGTWGNAPWDDTTWNKFETDAGKRVSLEMFGQPIFWQAENGKDNSFDYDGAYDDVLAHGAIPVVDMATNSTALTDITSGTYDTQIRDWALAAKAWNHPFFLRLDAEMNGTWYNFGAQARTNPQNFVNMWRHVHDIFTSVGANNVSWHWCPNVDPENIQTPLEQLYPGDAYVDWTGFTGYNEGGEAVSWIFDSTYNRVLAVAPTKPMMIGETGGVDDGYPGQKVQFINDLFNELQTTMTDVKGFCWFNWRTNEHNPPWDWEIESSVKANGGSGTGLQSFQQAISNSRYVAGTPTMESSFPTGQKVPIP